MGAANTRFPVLAGNPTPPLRSSRPALDPEGFCSAVGEALALHLKSQESPTDADPFYVHDFPNERLTTVDAPFDGVTFEVISSNPADRLNDGTKARKPFTFEAPDPTRTGYVIKTDTWFETVTIEFTAWSKSSSTRGQLVNWFHRFILLYANSYKFFEARGADKFQFVSRGQDGFETHEEQQIYFGTLTYQVRVQFLNTYSERMVTQLTTVAQLGKDQQTILTPA